MGSDVLCFDGLGVIWQVGFTMLSEGFMDIPIGARRNEDIALDLLKFIASTTNVVKSGSGGTPGFAGASAPKPEDQVGQLLELYGRCKTAVEGSK